MKLLFSVFLLLEMVWSYLDIQLQVVRNSTSVSYNLPIKIGDEEAKIQLFMNNV